MNIAVLTIEEPHYLPAFFERFFETRAADTRAVYVVPTRHGKESAWDMVRKYIRAFGVLNFVRVAWKTGKAKLLDRLGGRGRSYSVAAACQSRGVAYEPVANVNAESFRDRLREMRIDLLISVSCPQIFRKPLIETPPLGTLNVHGAQLPKYRGLLPSFWMMTNGEEQAGVTVFLVNEDIDAGDVVQSVDFPIEPNESLHEFIVRSKQIACDALLSAVAKVESGEYQTRPLHTEGGSYFSFPTREAYRAFRRRGRRLW